MALSTVKRLAADIMKVGINKVRIDPGNTNRAEEALTRNDVRDLINDGVVFKLPKGGRRHKESHRGRGQGSRKGTRAARTPPKEKWMAQVRSQRSYLAQLVSDGVLSKEHKRMVYMKIKSGIFKSKKTMHAYLKDNALLKEKK
ncbi:50S ribosomal protein L19e [Candidatus Micrarchaeota archaeon]|nr:50S ribosomal protein L19e [Candidatus Micrarchaeota archaeon]